MKLYFISALCKSRELFGLLPLLLAAIRLGKYLHVMAFEGIHTVFKEISFGLILNFRNFVRAL